LNEKLRAKVKDLETNLQQQREKHHAAVRERDTCQMTLEKQTIELESLRRKITTLESRLDMSNKEKGSLSHINLIQLPLAEMILTQDCC
jgi:predicted  nucleic acid-binding Zn-ribbon protein